MKGCFYVNKAQITCYIHRVVVSTFKKIESDKGVEVNHKDHTWYNNNERNLEWVTHSENQQDKIKRVKNTDPVYVVKKDEEIVMECRNRDEDDDEYFPAQVIVQNGEFLFVPFPYSVVRKRKIADL